MFVADDVAVVLWPNFADREFADTDGREQVLVNRMGVCIDQDIEIALVRIIYSNDAPRQ